MECISNSFFIRVTKDCAKGMRKQWTIENMLWLIKHISRMVFAQTVVISKVKYRIKKAGLEILAREPRESRMIDVYLHIIHQETEYKVRIRNI